MCLRRGVHLLDPEAPVARTNAADVRRRFALSWLRRPQRSARRPTDPGRPRPRTVASLAFVLVVYLVVQVLLASHALGQSLTRDPYTRHDPVRMTEAGIVALQSFVWGGNHTTRDIQSLMGHEPFRFVETRHFRLAVSLAPQPAPVDRRQRDALRQELRELQTVLPGVDPGTSTLDGWLRAHLYAWRLEKLYGDVASVLGATEETMQRARPGTAHAATYTGEGPFLGMRDKYLVVLCRDSGSVNAYLRNFLDRAAPRRTERVLLQNGASFLLATAESMPEEDLRDDRALHACVLHHTVRMLLDGYRGPWHECPPWFAEGLAHWFRAARIPDRACFVRRPAELPLQPAHRSWSAKVRLRLEGGSLPSSDALFDLSDPSAMRFADHLAAWSRIDFLIRAHPEAFPLIARALKGPEPTAVRPQPTPQVVASRQRPALRAVFGWSPADFDAAWSRWVLAEYSPTGS